MAWQCRKCTFPIYKRVYSARISRRMSMAVPVKKFYGKVNVRVPPEDSDDSVLASDSDEEPLIMRTPQNTIIQETDDDEENNDVHPMTEATGGKRRQVKRKRRSNESKEESSDEEVNWNKEVVGILQEPQWTETLLTSDLLFSPIDYFKMFVGNGMITHIVMESNRYAIQRNPNKPLQLTEEELERWLGIVLCMSVVKLPSSRLYWSKLFRVALVADAMTCNRFETIKSNLHFCDNLADGSNRTADPLYKIRSVLDHIVSNCKVLPKCEKYSVDEQIIPFKGRSGLKMYNPKKPKKWGYKMFIICDVKGLIYNFELYTGKENHPPELQNIGASGNVVLRLASIVPSDQNCKIYYDNWFCSIPLQAALVERKIYSLGTVRQNRLKGCNHESDANMKKRGRGAIDEKRCTVRNITYGSTKWYDNRCVNLLSNFVSAEPVKTVRRYDRSKKEYINIQCPNAVVIYNKFMGGVDLVDAMVALYRIPIRSKKYYLRIFFHLMDLMCVNAWFLHRRDSTEADRMPLLEFKVSIMQALVKSQKGGIPSRKVGRPSSSSIRNQYQEKSKKGPAAPIPIDDVRLDEVGHFPTFAEKKGRCKHPGCKGTPKVKCSKCDVYLCFTPASNCFLNFHTNP